ncbi:hypothetical protein ACFQV2_29980 [Actinokineospora soli]|uniref:Uncharacterized protein n=1 Tax=Actinokineospora soli TaxID=1048753 RepID=A0ABW2TVL0_9PSEU
MGTHVGVVIEPVRLLEPLGIKRGVLEVPELCGLINRCGLFDLPAPVTELDGAQLAGATKEAVPEKAVHEITKFFRAKFDEVLTPGTAPGACAGSPCAPRTRRAGTCTGTC